MVMNIYLVGGAVRDQLLGLSVQERDWVVVGAHPSDLLSQGFKQVGKDFPVFLDPKTQEEYALARTERKTGKGYTGFDCYAAPDVRLEQDLSRRDLTINAMAQAPDGTLIDPFKGQKDLKDRILRHVSPAFSEDPLRILRIARFAATLAGFHFSIAAETLDLMRSMVEADELEALVPERVWQETHKALCGADPTQYFLVLRACGALKRLWPDLDKLWGIPQPPRYHPEVDTGVHVMMVLGQATQLSQDPITRFAALCHDLGKGQTPAHEWPSHHGHEERGVALIRAFCERYRVPHVYRDLAIITSRFHLHCHKIEELKPSTILQTLEKMDAFRQPDRFYQFLIACEADAKGRTDRTTIDYVQAGRFREAYELAKAVEAAPLIAAGATGEVLGQRLHQARVRALEQAFG
jgi:tRNA nucleotidyltransferase (CCA-adding enzyme)